MKTKYAAFALCLATVASAIGSPVTLVENGEARAVIVAPSGRPTLAAEELQRYVEKATGARLRIVVEDRIDGSKGVTSRVFVGPVQAARRVVDLSELQPEGFVIKTDGDDLFIVGRDQTDSGMQVEGTFYGVYEFLERYLGVRWLMPGPLGEITPKQATLQVGAVDIRQEPLLWQRRIRDSKVRAHRDRVRQILADWDVPIEEWEAAFSSGITGPWFARQRLASRVQLLYGHAYHGWWDKYHEQYPDIFALQPDGTRVNPRVRERLCVSNPTLWDLVAREKIEELRAKPFLTAASVSPNDGGPARFCRCERCRAWDSPAAQAMYRENPDMDPGPGPGPYPPLTDRYFRFYNEVARRVKREMPDRYLGCYAYSVYRTPPVVVDRLEDNLIVGYVGFSSYWSEEERQSNREEWLQWSRVATQLFLRPNLLWQPIGLPVNYVHKLGEDLRFLADHGMRATDFDGGIGNWGTQGLNYYVLAKLLWDPYQDVDLIVDDYCRAAYGQGAGAMKEYYRRLEQLTDRIAADDPMDPSKRRADINLLTDYYTDPMLTELHACVERAAAAIGSGDPAALERVGLVATGLEYTRKTRDLLASAADVRERRSTPAEFRKIHDQTLEYYKSLVLSWAVSIDHDYSYIRRGLGLNPAQQLNHAKTSDDD